LKRRALTDIVSPSLSQKSDKQWQFKVFGTSSSVSSVQKQIDNQSAAVTQSFKTRIRYLTNTPRNAWVSPEAKRLKGFKDIYEIRFFSDRQQFRPLGFFCPNCDDFTILIWAAKKGAIYDPAQAIETSDSRRKKILSGEGCCMPLKILGEKFPFP
jgi:hypothetical protein